MFPAYDHLAERVLDPLEVDLEVLDEPADAGVNYTSQVGRFYIVKPNMEWYDAGEEIPSYWLGRCVMVDYSRQPNGKSIRGCRLQWYEVEIPFKVHRPAERTRSALLFKTKLTHEQLM